MKRLPDFVYALGRFGMKINVRWPHKFETTGSAAQSLGHHFPSLTKAAKTLKVCFTAAP
jgi:hypothetical protein